MPHAGRYPYQWLWDSCFHAVLWAELGRDDRAVTELRHVFRRQDELGFVPHVDYERDPDVLAGFWGRRGSSSVTQPPLYGWAVAELRRRGVEVPAEIVDRAIAGIGFLLSHRHRVPNGLVTVCHPWESGCDDSPRWDDWGAADPARWYDVKGALLDSIERTAGGAPLANPDFPVAPAGFNALLSWSAAELAGVTDHDWLRSSAAELADALKAQWDGDLATWVDAGPPASSSGRVRTLDGLLPVLVDGDRLPAVRRQLDDRRAHGGRYGPTGVHRAERVFAPRTYWRGPVWPQLAYLLWLGGAEDVAGPTVAGAVASGLAEYWDPDDGTGLGAVPQSWSGLALLMDG